MVGTMNAKHSRRRMALAAIAMGASGSLARADDPTSMGSFDDWESFTYQDQGKPVCYVYSTPKKTEAAKKVKRDPVYFLITNYPGRKLKGQVSTIIGYPFKESSTVTVKVNDASFELYTNGDAAWAAAPETEVAIVKAMKTAKALTVTGTSWKGTETTDTYSLAGIGKALDKIDSSCK